MAITNLNAQRKTTFDLLHLGYAYQYSNIGQNYLGLSMSQLSRIIQYMVTANAHDGMLIQTGPYPMRVF